MCSKGNGMAKAAMALSMVTLILAAYVFFTQQEIFGIAGTQWILISIAMGVYANFFARSDDKAKIE
jgi:hypothetical protein